jgi:hypothetical protein
MPYRPRPYPLDDIRCQNGSFHVNISDPPQIMVDRPGSGGTGTVIPAARPHGWTWTMKTALFCACDAETARDRPCPVRYKEGRFDSAPDVIFYNPRCAISMWRWPTRCHHVSTLPILGWILFRRRWAPILSPSTLSATRCMHSTPDPCAQVFTDE